MMNADDEPQLDDLNTSPTLGSFELKNKHPENKINDAFGITNDVLKLSINTTTSSVASPISYFNQFNRATEATTVKTIDSLTSKPDSNSNILFSNSKSPLMQQNFNSILANTSSVTLQPPITLPSTIASPPTSISSLTPPLKPPTSTSKTPPPPSTLTPSIATQSPAPSTIAPPIASPLQVPPIGSATKSNANPYSARGAALNKKIYEPVVTSVPIQAPMNILAPSTQQTQFQSVTTSTATTMGADNIFVPQPSVEQTVPTSLPPPTEAVQPQLTSSFMPSFGPPVSSYPNSQNTLEQQYQTNNDASFSSSSFGYYQQQQQATSMPLADPLEKPVVQNNMWNWLTHNRLVNKLKSGVESVITVIDPQMRDYLSNAHQPINVLNTSTNKATSDAIREAFQQAGYLKLTVMEYESRTTTMFAVQVVGQACALQAVQEKINNSYQYCQQDCVLVATQDFIVELTQDCWYDQTCVMLKDPVKNIEIVLFTEAIPVPLELIQQLQQKTFNLYAQRWSGYSAHLSNNSPIDWYEMMYGITRKNILLSPFKSIVGIYKHKIMNLNNANMTANTTNTASISFN